jgi:amino acid transporter
MAQGYDRKSLPYASALQPYAAWYAAISCFIICLVCVPRSFDCHHPKANLPSNHL